MIVQSISSEALNAALGGSNFHDKLYCPIVHFPERRFLDSLREQFSILNRAHEMQGFVFRMNMNNVILTALDGVRVKYDDDPEHT